MTVLSNIITPSNVLTTTNTATVTNKTLTSPTVAGMTVSDGTANGVTFLNGSKVLTSGSALTWNGSTLLVGGNTRFGSGAVIPGFATASDASLANNASLRGTNAAGSTAFELIKFNTSDQVVINSDGADAVLTSAATSQRWIIGTEGMRLTSTGLGIGTSSPAQKLHCLADTSSALFQGGTLGGITFLKTGQTGMQLFSDATGTLKIYDNNAGAAVLAMVNQNLGVGTTSPQSRLHVSDAVAGGQLLVTSNENNSSAKIGSLATMNYTNAEEPVLAISVEGGASENIVQIGGGPGEFNAATLIKFSTAANTTTTGGSERARITSAGDLLLGTATANGTGGVTFASLGATTPYGLINQTASGTLMFFRYNSTTVGSISQNTTATAYNTSSDYRLKNTIAPMTGALEKVALLKPCTYKWNANGSDGEGFIAHELAEVCPDAVTGSKDAVDAEGNPQYQGIDTSFLVATLTAAIQEQQAIIESLKARLDAANL